MNKVCMSIGVVFSIFILCSLTYLPISANDSIDLVIKNQPPENQNSKINTEVVFNELITKIKNKNNDCDCDKHKSSINKHPIICSILTPIWIIVALITALITPIMNPPFIYFFIAELGTEFNCWWG